jgi:hypothetical protein
MDEPIIKIKTAAKIQTNGPERIFLKFILEAGPQPF